MDTNDTNKKIEKSKIVEREEEVLEFWQKNKIFEKSLEKESPEGNFVFYEGPPTANGKPGIHHLEARAFKDVIPRYKTMRGYHVRRKAGWDTHGLPVELQVEKQLGLKSKKEIESYGVAEFNKKCKESVWEYVELWSKFTKRIGYWVDEKNAYVTYKNEYIESLWSVFAEVNKKNLLYKDYKVVPWCPRCGTALSSHELAQGYETVKDLSVYVKFELEEEPGTFVLAWTTTPWTLPGNVALAVGESIDYVKIKLGEEKLILAKNRISVVGEGYEVVEEIKGKSLIGRKYKPLYDFLKKGFEDKDKESFARAYKIYSADFVTTEDGTGVVHTAVMYGQDDFVVGTKIGLPKYHLVKEDGTFKDITGFLSGRFVKDEETAVEVIKDLAHRSLLFKKEKYEHSYPHCWRCKTPLIYYARDSWYIRMSKLKERLVKENESINWEPSHIKNGRFGEWLREIKDWAISRERYWGTPLPVWQNNKGEITVIGSIEDLKKHTKISGNKYYVMRHGEYENTENDKINADIKNIFHLTENGKKEVAIAANNIKKEGVDLIITSPFMRCVETADIVRQTLGLPESSIKVDDRLWEERTGSEYEGKTWQEFRSKFSDPRERYEKRLPNTENFIDVKKRVGELLYSVEEEYKNKRVLFVTHQLTVNALYSAAMGTDMDKILDLKREGRFLFKTGEFGELPFVPLPHNENYELDLHKPYIDDVGLVDENGNPLTRIKEVMDVWFDSGAMPFAQDHYVFRNDSTIEKVKSFFGNKSSEETGLKYPADYIAEAIDQTRGWFYTLHAVGILMDKGKAYKNVVCLGHILDADGKKMSKSLGNIVDPWSMIDKYGVDALRLWMYSVNQPGDSKNFDEKTVDELVKKIFNPLSNIVSFYLMYGDKSITPKSDSKNVLDQWIISRLCELVNNSTDYLDKYKIFEASRLVRDFVNDFSTWYVRRSRDRFKSENIEDKNNALATTLYVLKELAKYMAPFTPFFAEDVYSQVKGENDKESVHLCDWPKVGKADSSVLDKMNEVRKGVSLALEKRNEANIKIRQPLNSLKFKNENLKLEPEYLDLIKAEVNIKEVVFDSNIEEEVWLDTNITEELKEEGEVREFVRTIQEERKTHGFVASARVKTSIHTNEHGRKIIESKLGQIQKITNSEIFFEDNDGKEVEIGDGKYKIKFK